jgi:ABC-type multidrug transport system permease subunit
MYPIRVLPGWMQAISAAIPVRWALQALDASLLGTGDLRVLGLDWGMAVGISLVILAAAHWLEGKVHDQIRITGELRSL